MEREVLVRFIKGYFAGQKLYDDSNVLVEVEKEYKDPREWLAEVKGWETFQYLRKINNFAGDLMKRYFPNEI